ncbi:MAG: transcription antitermination factor NusB [Phycisphaeraceae bacterium]
MPASLSPARRAAAEAIARDAARFPNLPPSHLDTTRLASADAALATAIHRTVLQRWLTLEHLLTPLVKPGLARVEPALRAILLTGATQQLFMDRLPAYAIVNDAAELARVMVRPGAAALANAVLRRVGELVAGREPQTPWQPASDVIPLDEGVLRLARPLLPSAEDHLDRHLAVATSHPPRLVRRWLETYGPVDATAICRQAIRTPPTFVAVEPGFHPPAGEEDGVAVESEAGVTHLLWRSDHARLRGFLAEHPARRVQDPASTASLAAARELSLATVLDACAGQGTKTRQLVAEHPEAVVYASDPDAGRREELGKLAGAIPRVRVLEPGERPPEPVDLLLLDVPCSNTGVLARRPEARYRFNSRSLTDVTRLQREIIANTLPAVRRGGWVLYATCSIEPEENLEQVRHILQQQGGELVTQQQILPGGRSAGWHDGSYHALIRLP